MVTSSVKESSMWPPMARPFLSQNAINFTAEVPGVGAGLARDALLKAEVAHDAAGVEDDDGRPCASWLLAVLGGP